jgi:hypothetical protein
MSGSPSLPTVTSAPATPINQPPVTMPVYVADNKGIPPSRTERADKYVEGSTAQAGKKDPKSAACEIVMSPPKLIDTTPYIQGEARSAIPGSYYSVIYGKEDPIVQVQVEFRVSGTTEAELKKLLDPRSSKNYNHYFAESEFVVPSGARYIPAPDQPPVGSAWNGVFLLHEKITATQADFASFLHDTHHPFLSNLTSNVKAINTLENILEFKGRIPKGNEIYGFTYSLKESQPAVVLVDGKEAAHSDKCVDIDEGFLTVEKIAGQEGSFIVRALKKVRYIDPKSTNSKVPPPPLFIANSPIGALFMLYFMEQFTKDAINNVNPHCKFTGGQL